MVDLPLVLHAGYHKTATTYLQKNVFRCHPEILYLGRPWVNEALRPFFRALKYTHDLDFDPEEFKASFRRILESVASQPDPDRESEREPKVVLVSSEGLHSGPEWFGLCVVRMARRLRSVFYPCKIILGIRNQPDYTESNYRTYLYHGGKLPFGRFVHESLVGTKALFPKLQYDKVLSLYRDLFGEEAVHVYLQERLKRAPAAELRNLMAFVGVDETVEFKHETVYAGWSKIPLECLRLVNKRLAQDYMEQYFLAGRQGRRFFRERLRRRIRRLLRKAERVFFSRRWRLRYLDEATREHIAERFMASNKALSEQLGEEIKQLGYRF